MSLRDDLAALASEKDTYLDRLAKLEERKSKVRPELFDKLYGELDDKLTDVNDRIAEVEEALRQEEEAARRAEEAARLQAEAEAAAAAEAAAKRRVAESQTARRDKVLAKHADEIEALRAEWNKQRDGKRAEYEDFIQVCRDQIAVSQEKRNAAAAEIEEWHLRAEIGEFEDDSSEYDARTGELAAVEQKCDAEIAAANRDIADAENNVADLDAMAEPDFAAQILERYADELKEPVEPLPAKRSRPAPSTAHDPATAEFADDRGVEESEAFVDDDEEEEIYEPEPVTAADLAAARVLHEEALDGEDVGEDVVTEYEEIYEDEAEQEFFRRHESDSLVSVTINPCVIEKKQGGDRIHNLILGGGKTMIGSSETCDVYLPYEGIDSRHAWIKVDRKGQYLLKDLGSRNGTDVNGKKIKKTYLNNGDLLKVGNVELIVKLL